MATTDSTTGIMSLVERSLARGTASKQMEGLLDKQVNGVS